MAPKRAASSATPTATCSRSASTGRPHDVRPCLRGRPLTPYRAGSVVVLGAGVAGLAATLALARDGHQVKLVERDQFPVGDTLDTLDALDWERKGIPHFQQPHAFT